MRFGNGRGACLCLLAASLVTFGGERSLDAQVGAVGPIRPPITPNVGGSIGRPAVIAEEGWAEVLTVTNKWVVLQNSAGQQYPVSFDSIQLFIVRWPISIDSIPADALVEATGPDNGQGGLLTSHVDVYIGGARGLVSPTFFYVNGSGRIITQIDFMTNPQAYGDIFGLTNPIQQGVLAGEIFVHVVGPPSARIPLRLNTPGNSGIAILPATPGGISATQITPGTSSLLKPGDLVYFVATGMGTRSLSLTQMVVYKNGPPN